jgi:hypothetical protein
MTTAEYVLICPYEYELEYGVVRNHVALYSTSHSAVWNGTRTGVNIAKALVHAQNIVVQRTEIHVL